MKRKKRALINSIISLVLCVSMLMGTTFAWFTDSVTTGINTIAAGNLDVELYHTNAAVENEQVTPTTKLFMDLQGNPILWEPGVISYENLRITNEGDLALIYQFAINTANENYVVDPSGTKYGLSQILKVGVVEGGITAADRAGVVSSVENASWTTLANFFRSGSLLPEGDGEFEKTWGVVIYWEPGEKDNYWNLNNGKVLDRGETLSIDLGINLIATQEQHESDNFGNDYDAAAMTDVFPVFTSSGSVSTTVVPNDQNQTSENVVMSTGQVTASVPAGVQLAEGATELTMTITELDESESNLTLGENEVMRSLDVHIDGINADNTVPMIIDLGEILPVGLNEGNAKLYHVEKGVTNEMTRVDTVNEVDAHNEFYYDPASGRVVVAMATFSEVAMVVDEENAWNGEFDYSWYKEDDTSIISEAGTEPVEEYIIANADQLAAFGAIVGGMDGNTQDSFKGKTVKLISDINLGDAESKNNSNLIFYPIGYYNSVGSYEKASGEDVTSDISSFEGTFDGNGHTIANFYQNTWEMFGGYNRGYSGTPNHYNDAMGLFGYILNGTVKNLTVDNFSSDGEFAPTGVISAYAVNSTFENIAITNCNPRVYNTGNGGIVGVGGSKGDTDEAKLTFTNITIDNTNKISALWGSWDVACGGLAGMFRGDGHVYMTNCHVAAQIDVNNDVCGNYQYYWYRYSGMMVGTNYNMTTDANGYTVPETDKYHAEGCTVHFGDWNDYYYCELVANSLASYTHDHQFSRLTQVDSVDKNNMTVTIDGVITAIPTSGRYNYVVVNGDASTENATCYHFVDGAVWNHEDAGYETKDINGDGIVDSDVLKEDKQHYYLPFNQLFTGYGWGVKHIPVYNDGTRIEGLDITILDREEANSVEKFKKLDTAMENITSGTTIMIGDLFEAATIKDNNLKINAANVQVTVSPIVDGSTAGATYIANESDWTKGTLAFSGIGVASITITDYYFCIPTTIIITVMEPDSVDKFDLVFRNTDDYLYRVGNANAVALESLFKAIDGAEIGNVEITISAQNNSTVFGTYTANSSDWTKGTIQFSGTGPVWVTIDDDAYANAKTLCLEVVTAKNITTAESATTNDVVLLNDISGTFTITNGHTFYGNGFTVKLPASSVQNIGQGFTGYISLGAAQDDGIANGGHLDNVRIEGPVYPEMYIYRDQAKITDTSDADYGDGNNMRYFKNSVIIYGGNCTISNSYISGSRTALCLRGGNNVTIENTTLSGGSYANMQICAGSIVTLKDLTTVQTDVSDSYDKGKTAHGLGIAVDSNIVDLYIEGELNQYNWLCEEQWKNIVPSNYQSVFPDFFTDTTFNQYWHYLNSEENPYVNMAFIYACNWDIDKIHDNRPNVNYEACAATIASVDGGVYSKVNTSSGDSITNADLADPGYNSPGFNPVAPVFNFDNTVNSDDDDVNDASDTYCVYDESSGTLKIGVNGDSKVIDLSGVSITKNGVVLPHMVYFNGAEISGNTITIKSSDGSKQTLTFKASSTDVGYDKDGDPIEGTIVYTWTVTVEIAGLTYPAPVWNMGDDYTFDTSNCVYAYYQTSQGYGEAVPIYEGIKVNYYNKSGELVESDLSGNITLPSGSNNANANAFTYELSDGSTLTMKYSSGWKSGATTHQFTEYNSKAYVYPQSLDNDNYVRAKTTNQDFNVKITYTFTDPNGQSTETVTMNWYNAAASNGSVSTVQWKTFDSENGKETECITPDTLVTLANGTQVNVDSLTGSEELLVWNLETGTFDSASILFVDSDSESEYEIIHLHFSDGSDVKVISEHGFWDYNLNKYVYLDKNASDYIGHTFAKHQNDKLVQVQLIDVVIETEVTTAWSPVTCDHLCYFVNGMLSMPGGVGGLFNIFDVDAETMTYDVEAMTKDIETYGLFTYEELSSQVELSEEMFYTAGGPFLKVSIGKGNMTMNELITLIKRYSKFFE